MFYTVRMMTIPKKSVKALVLTSAALLLATSASVARKDDDNEEMRAGRDTIGAAANEAVDDEVKAIPGEPATEIKADKDSEGDEAAAARELPDPTDITAKDDDRRVDRDMLTASGPDPKDYDVTPYYTQGLSFLKAKRYQEALDCFNRCLKIDPNYYKASFQKAVVFQVTGYPDHAIKRYEQLLRYHPEMAEAHINLGSLYRDRDKLRAESEFRKAIDVYYYSLPAHYNLANLLLDMGRYEDAMKEYKACLKFNRKTAFIRNNMGVIYQKKRYYEEAAEQFTMALKLSPQNKTFQDNLRLAKKQLAAKSGAVTQ